MYVRCLGWRWWVNHRTLSVFCSLFSLCVVWVSLFAVFWWSWSCLWCRWWWWQWLRGRERKKETREPEERGRRQEVYHSSEGISTLGIWDHFSLFLLFPFSSSFRFPSSVYPYYRGWTLGLIRGANSFFSFSSPSLSSLIFLFSWHRMMPHCMSRDHRRGRRSLFTLPSPSVYVALVWCSLSSSSYSLPFLSLSSLLIKSLSSLSLSLLQHLYVEQI